MWMFPKFSWNQVLTVIHLYSTKKYYLWKIHDTVTNSSFLGIVFHKYWRLRQSDIGQSDIGVLFKQKKTHFETRFFVFKSWLKC